MELLASPAASSPHPARSPPAIAPNLFSSSRPGPLHTHRPETDGLTTLPLGLKTRTLWPLGRPEAGERELGFPVPPTPGLEWVPLLHRPRVSPVRPKAMVVPGGRWGN